MIMETNPDQRLLYDEPFKRAAVHFFVHSGRSLEAVSAELGLRPTDLQTWKRQFPVPRSQGHAAKPLDPLRQLRAENLALRNEIVHLKIQWEVLRTALGILSAPAALSAQLPCKK
jgi:transposase-like protein